MARVTHLQTALTGLEVLIGQVEGLGTNHAIGVILMYCQQSPRALRSWVCTRRWSKRVTCSSMHTLVPPVACANPVTHLFVTPSDILQLFENFTVYSAG